MIATGSGVGTGPGTVGLIHPESHFTDEKAGRLRSATYRRLRRHWQFINELSLFEIHHLVSYGVHTYGKPQNPQFLQATSLYHPDTVGRSLNHDGSGAEPGLKDEHGKWDLRPHASRIQHVDTTTLATWHALLENDDVPIEQSRMVYTVNKSTAAVLDKLSKAPRIGELGLKFSSGWHEKNDRTKGYFESEWGVPESWDDVILQGPHLHVATPFYKQPNPTMLHNQDWTPVDLEALPADAIPATSYKPRGDRKAYDAAYTHWNPPLAEPADSARSARDFYRVAWRAMAANTGERTLIPAIIPPGASHVNGVFAVGSPGFPARSLAALCGVASSLVVDFSVRAAPKSGIYQGVFERLPVLLDEYLVACLALRSLRLIAVTANYETLWADAWSEEFAHDSWAIRPVRASTPTLGSCSDQWDTAVPIRGAADRRQASIEIDALVALGLGVSIDELVTIYRTQFPVLSGYDRSNYFYDRNGRLVPSSVLARWRLSSELSTEERSEIHPQSGVMYTYEPPFVTKDRERDLRETYAVFQERLASRRSNSA